MTDSINQFFLQLSSYLAVDILFIAYIWVMLALVVYRIDKDKAGDGTAILFVTQILCNVGYVFFILPEYYLLITRVFIFLLPYIVATVFILYMDFLEKKKDA